MIPFWRQTGVRIRSLRRLYRFAQACRDRGNLGGGGGDDHGGRNNFRRCYALRLDPHFHHAA